MSEKKLFSVNSDFSEFDLQQLEERLETDPLAVGGLVDLSNGNGIESISCHFSCPSLEKCNFDD